MSCLPCPAPVEQCVQQHAAQRRARARRLSLAPESRSPSTSKPPDHSSTAFAPARAAPAQAHTRHGLPAPRPDPPHLLSRLPTPTLNSPSVGVLLSLRVAARPPHKKRSKTSIGWLFAETLLCGSPTALGSNGAELLVPNSATGPLALWRPSFLEMKLDFNENVYCCRVIFSVTDRRSNG